MHRKRDLVFKNFQEEYAIITKKTWRQKNAREDA